MIAVVWKFLRAGGWIVVVALMVVGWIRAEIRRAVARGEATEMARQVRVERARFEKAAEAHSVSEAAASARADSVQRVRDAERRELARLRVVTSAQKQSADSVIATLIDSLPQLAGVRSALDSLDLRANREAEARERAEQDGRDLQGRLDVSNGLLADARQVIADQAETITKLEKVGASGTGLGLVRVLLGGAVLVAATVVVVVVSAGGS